MKINELYSEDGTVTYVTNSLPLVYGTIKYHGYYGDNYPYYAMCIFIPSSHGKILKIYQSSNTRLFGERLWDVWGYSICKPGFRHIEQSTYSSYSECDIKREFRILYRVYIINRIKRRIVRIFNRIESIFNL